MSTPRPKSNERNEHWADALIRGTRMLLAPVASLKITVALFAIAVFLVFFGTIAQKSTGIWTVVQDYFYSYAVKVQVQHLFEFTKIFFGFPMKSKTEMWFWFPGGFLIGLLMFANLLFAHTLQFVNLISGVRKEVNRGSPWSRLGLLVLKRTGIYILHGGVILLLVGEWVTREGQLEQQMTIPEGGSSNFAFDTRKHELAFIDGSDPAHDRVTVVTAERLREALAKGETIRHPDLPVDVRPVYYFVNSNLDELGSPALAARALGGNPSGTGLGAKFVAWKEPEVSGVDTTNKMDVPSGYVELLEKDTDKVIGTYLVTTILPSEQIVDIAGKKTSFALRHARHYKPYRLELIDFKFERYIGTSTAKNYSSQVRLIDPEQGQNRETTISMNEPLRHRGETYYQSSFTPDEKTTILQVVYNPAAELPYISCALVTLGMIVHFGIYLVQFLIRMFTGRLGARTRAEPGAPTPQAPVVLAQGEKPLDIAGGRRPILEWLLFPAGALVLAAAYLLLAAWPTTPRSGRLDLSELARLPVVDGGRVKPLDTVARVDLRLLTHGEEYADEGKAKHSAMKWFMDTATAPKPAEGEKWLTGAHENRVFRIENDEVRKLMNLGKREGLRYSIKDIQSKFEAFDTAAKAAMTRQKAGAELDLFEVKILELRKQVELYLEVWQGQAPRLLPPGGDAEWRTPAAAREAAVDRTRVRIPAAIAARGLPSKAEDMTEEQQREFVAIFEGIAAEEGAKDEAAAIWERVRLAYKADDPQKFDKAVAELKAVSERDVPAPERRRAEFETFLNDVNLSYHCTAMYVIGAVMMLVGWLALLAAPAFGNGLRRAVFWWLVVTLIVHTANLLARMYLMDRPLVFVTNLHSSAIFIGWGIAVLCLVIELVYPLGIGNFIAAVLGFATGVVAIFLAKSGDTLEMMQAVLDTNFWLATHVSTVTLGYSATYVAGFIGLIYVALLCVPEQLMLKRVIRVGVGPTSREMELGRLIGQFLYAVICFATLLSFVGTVLGGIWADQSWGRFWGWDPKENGAVLIVLWNVLILHARWAGLVKDRGIAVLALGGNMITTWSWFGTNQLGVGLHAYGFSNKLAFGCMLTWVIHAVIIAYGMLPWRYIYSGTGKRPSAPPPVASGPPPRANRARRA